MMCIFSMKYNLCYSYLSFTTQNFFKHTKFREHNIKSSRLEPIVLTPNDEGRPDGLTLSAFTQGKSLCWDATCADTFCSTALSNTATSAGAAAAEAEERKRNHYQDTSGTYRLEPAAIEITGAIGPSTGRLLSELVKKIVSKTGECRASEWIYQRISVAVMRGNAASIISCTPD